MTIGSRVKQTPPGMPGAGFIGVGIGGRPSGGLSDSVRVTVSPGGSVAGASAVNAAIEADSATRNDALGKLFHRAFNLPAPAMMEGLKG